MLKVLSREIRVFLRIARYEYALVPWPLRFSLFSLAFLSLSLLLPWLSYDAYPTEIGLAAGGAGHLFVIQQCLLKFSRFRASYFTFFECENLVAAHNDRSQQARRLSLFLCLYGLLGILLCIILLIYFGLYYFETKGPVDIRFGFYLTLFASISLFCSGLFYMQKDF